MLQLVEAPFEAEIMGGGGGLVFTVFMLGSLCFSMEILKKQRSEKNIRDVRKKVRLVALIVTSHHSVYCT